MTDAAYFCPLSHEGVLAVRGPDAAKFLQGQLTCNLNYLTAETSSLGARCTPKGRMQSSFRIVLDGDGYLLAMASELLQLQQADLNKYAVFSKSRLNDESGDWCRFGLAGGDGSLVSLGLDLPQTPDSVVRSNGMIAIRLPDGRVELWTPGADAEQVRTRLAAQLEETPVNRWLLDQVRAGIGQVFGSTRELFIPQMINLQALGGVSFKKGCYTGQEIVARMHYRGTAKKRLYLGRSREHVSLQTQLMHGSECAGEILSVSRNETGDYEFLVILPCELVTNGASLLLQNQGETPSNKVSAAVELLPIPGLQTH